MTVIARTFGKRPAPHLANYAGDAAGPQPAATASGWGAANPTEIRIHRNWRDLLLPTVIGLFGYARLRLGVELDLTTMLMALFLVAVSIAMIINHFMDFPRLEIDADGFRTPGLITSRSMRWEDLRTLNADPFNWSGIVTARTDKKGALTSSETVVIRSSVFKHPKLVFVAELLIRRPDLAETVHEVMHKVGAGHLLEDL